MLSGEDRSPCPDGQRRRRERTVSIHIKDAENDAHAALPGFPEKVYWPQLVKVLEGEGYAAEVKEDTVAVTW